MTERTWRVIEPVDVLMPRGNQLFGQGGQHGRSLMPPWPSVAAGAIRSRMLSDAGVDFDAFRKGKRVNDAVLGDVLGTPEEPGTFRIAWFSLARWRTGQVEPILPLPADVFVPESAEESITRFVPEPLPKALTSSAPTPMVPILKAERRVKPKGDVWASPAALSHWVAGNAPSRDELLQTTDLWTIDSRLGIGLNRNRRSAEEGLLYTTEAVAFRCGVGFLVGIAGADGAVPEQGLLRFGGDGRSARLQACRAAIPEPDWKIIEREKRFALMAVTPTLLDQGWRSRHWPFQARLAAACVPRGETVSGWDLARRCPKPAQLSVPAGTVWFFDELESPIEALRKASATGLVEGLEPSRRAEGFNNVIVAVWPREKGE